MKLTTTVFTDPKCFADLEVEWLALLPKAATNTIFQTPQFLKTWWETLGCQVVSEKPCELHLVTFRDEDGVLQGIAPLFIHTTSQGKIELSFIGCVNVSDYLDVIVNKESSDAVYQALLSHIRLQKRLERLYWCSIPEKSATRAFLHSVSAQAQETVQDVSPYILLPSSCEEYLASLERKQRHEVKRKWRKLEELPHEFEVVTEAEQAKAALEEFIQLHKSSSSAKKEFWN